MTNIEQNLNNPQMIELLKKKGINPNSQDAQSSLANQGASLFQGVNKTSFGSIVGGTGLEAGLSTKTGFTQSAGITQSQGVGSANEDIAIFGKPESAGTLDDSIFANNNKKKTNDEILYGDAWGDIGLSFKASASKNQSAKNAAPANFASKSFVMQGSNSNKLSATRQATGQMEAATEESKRISAETKNDTSKLKTETNGSINDINALDNKVGRDIASANAQKSTKASAGNATPKKTSAVMTGNKPVGTAKPTSAFTLTAKSTATPVFSSGGASSSIPSISSGGVSTTTSNGSVSEVGVQNFGEGSSVSIDSQENEALSVATGTQKTSAATSFGSLRTNLDANNDVKPDYSKPQEAHDAGKGNVETAAQIRQQIGVTRNDAESHRAAATNYTKAAQDSRTTANTHQQGADKAAEESDKNSNLAAGAATIASQALDLFGVNSALADAGKAAAVKWFGEAAAAGFDAQEAATKQMKSEAEAAAKRVEETTLKTSAEVKETTGTAVETTGITQEGVCTTTKTAAVCQQFVAKTGQWTGKGIQALGKLLQSNPFTAIIGGLLEGAGLALENTSKVNEITAQAQETAADAGIENAQATQVKGQNIKADGEQDEVNANAAGVEAKEKENEAKAHKAKKDAKNTEKETKTEKGETEEKKSKDFAKRAQEKLIDYTVNTGLSKAYAALEKAFKEESNQEAAEAEKFNGLSNQQLIAANSEIEAYTAGLRVTELLDDKNGQVLATADRNFEKVASMNTENERLIAEKDNVNDEIEKRADELVADIKRGEDAKEQSVKVATAKSDNEDADETSANNTNDTGTAQSANQTMAANSSQTTNQINQSQNEKTANANNTANKQVAKQPDKKSDQKDVKNTENKQVDENNAEKTSAEANNQEGENKDGENQNTNNSQAKADEPAATDIKTGSNDTNKLKLFTM